MPKITYTDSSGTGRTVDAELGSTVMETAIRNNIPGIVRPNSRLSCQIKVTEDLDGLIVSTPDKQA